MKLPSTFRNLLLFGAAAAITFGAVVLVDRLYGKHLESTTKSLLYPAYSSARMRTSEFDLVYRINNLGFRGPDVELEKSEKPRIAFIGDSFTFGWGVEEEESWIGLLREEHQDLELLNLGRGGTHPMDHAQLAKKVLPILNPDHVFICLTSWNDLIQMQRVLDVESGAEIQTIPSFEIEPSGSSKFVQRWFPNLSRKFRGPADINLRWKMEADWILSSFSKDFNRLALSEQVASDFQEGLLNPSLVYDRLVDPNTEQRLCQSDSMVLLRTSEHLREVESACNGHNIGISFIVLPSRAPEDQPCQSSETRLKTQEPILEYPLDSIPANHSWFYPLDGHLTPEGNQRVADWISPILSKVSEPSQ